jgi:hypothetical protein
MLPSVFLLLAHLCLGFLSRPLPYRFFEPYILQVCDFILDLITQNNVRLAVLSELTPLLMPVFRRACSRHAVAGLEKRLIDIEGAVNIRSNLRSAEWNLHVAYTE